MSKLWLKHGEYAEILRYNEGYRDRLYVLGPATEDYLEPTDWVVKIRTIKKEDSDGKICSTDASPRSFDV